MCTFDIKFWKSMSKNPCMQNMVGSRWTNGVKTSKKLNKLDFSICKKYFVKNAFLRYQLTRVWDRAIVEGRESGAIQLQLIVFLILFIFSNRFFRLPGVALESPKNVPSEPQEISEREKDYKNPLKINVLISGFEGLRGSWRDFWPSFLPSLSQNGSQAVFTKT